MRKRFGLYRKKILCLFSILSHLHQDLCPHHHHHHHHSFLFCSGMTFPLFLFFLLLSFEWWIWWIQQREKIREYHFFFSLSLVTSQEIKGKNIMSSEQDRRLWWQGICCNDNIISFQYRVTTQKINKKLNLIDFLFLGKMSMSFLRMQTVFYTYEKKKKQRVKFFNEIQWKIMKGFFSSTGKVQG